MNALKAAAACLVGYFLFAVFRFIIGFILPRLTAEFMLTPVEAGAFASAPALSGVLIMSLAGHIGDRLGKKLPLVIGMLMLWAGAFICSVSPSYILALISIFFAGLGAGFLGPNIYSLMGEIQPKSRASMIGITAAIYSFGGFAGSIIFGFTTAVYGWRISLGALAAVGLIHAAAMFLCLDSTLSKENSQVKIKPPGFSQFNSFRLRNIVIAGLSIFMGMYAQFVIMSWTPTYFMKAGIDPSFTGVIIAIYSLAGGFSSIISGRIADVFGEKKLLLFAGFIAATVSLPIYLYHLGLVHSVILMLMLGFFHFPYWNLVLSMVQRNADSNTVGVTMGIVQNIGTVGGMVGPTLAGLAIQSWGFEQGMIASVTMPLLLYAALIVLYKHTPKTSR
ncbi:MAG: MFS transporter [Candidatus Bathyarchaeia archaeon]